MGYDHSDPIPWGLTYQKYRVSQILVSPQQPSTFCICEYHISTFGTFQTLSRGSGATLGHTPVDPPPMGLTYQKYRVSQILVSPQQLSTFSLCYDIWADSQIRHFPDTFQRVWGHFGLYPLRPHTLGPNIPKVQGVTNSGKPTAAVYFFSML